MDINECFQENSEKAKQNLRFRKSKQEVFCFEFFKIGRSLFVLVQAGFANNQMALCCHVFRNIGGFDGDYFNKLDIYHSYLNGQ